MTISWAFVGIIYCILYMVLEDYLGRLSRQRWYHCFRETPHRMCLTQLCLQARLTTHIAIVLTIILFLNPKSHTIIQPLYEEGITAWFGMLLEFSVRHVADNNPRSREQEKKKGSRK